MYSFFRVIIINPVVRILLMYHFDKVELEDCKGIYLRLYSVIVFGSISLYLFVNLPLRNTELLAVT